MNRSAVLEQLQRHQQVILAILHDAEALLRAPHGRDIAGLARQRWTMVRALKEYQQFKHARIFDPMIAGDSIVGAARAARLKEACLAMDARFRAYVTRWSATDIDGGWTAFHPAALAMVAALRQHVAHEQAECAALVATAA